MKFALNAFVFLLIAGTASCSVLGHACPTEIECPQIDSSCTEAYPTSILMEDSVCPWCLVCIDKSVKVDASGCPDREVMCQGSSAPPENCKARIIYSYNNVTCDYCDLDVCVNESDVQFVGAN